MERLEFDLLFRWFVGIGVDDAAWDHSTFSKNRERLLEGDIAAKLLSAVLSQPRVKRLLSADHFSVDGTLVEAWASMKQRLDGGPYHLFDRSSRSAAASNICSAKKFFSLAFSSSSCFNRLASHTSRPPYLAFQL